MISSVAAVKKKILQGDSHRHFLFCFGVKIFISRADIAIFLNQVLCTIFSSEIYVDTKIEKRCPCCRRIFTFLLTVIISRLVKFLGENTINIHMPYYMKYLLQGWVVERNETNWQMEWH